MPRMTTAERTAIATPASGLQVYDTDLSTPYYYNGTAWVAGASASSDTTNDGWVDNAGNAVLSSGKVGIGTSTPQYLLETKQVALNNTNLHSAKFHGELENVETTGIITNSTSQIEIAAADSNNHTYAFGLEGRSDHKGSGYVFQSRGLTSSSVLSGNGTMYGGYGIYAGFQNSGSGTVTNGNGLVSFAINTGTGTITNSYGANLSVYNSGSGTNTNGYGLYISEVNATNRFGVYVNDANAKNYFAGNIGVGTNTPSEKLQVMGNGSFVGTGAKVMYEENGVASFSTGIFGTASDSRYSIFSAQANEVLSIKYSNGNVGIGTATPTEKLEVAGAIKIGTTTTATSTAGTIRFNTTTNKFEGYDGSAWVAFH